MNERERQRITLTAIRRVLARARPLIDAERTQKQQSEREFTPSEDKGAFQTLHHPK